jgi:NADP-dependent aldehyde dehydrogenase
VTTMIAGHDPRTGAALPPVAEAMSTADVDRIAGAAADAFALIRHRDRTLRAELLRAIADQVEAHRTELVQTAMTETGFLQAKLDGELTRAAYQFRLFAEVVEEGSFLEVTIDPAGDTPMGPRPDLRRWLVALGPVAVFGSSNFPFAFSVLGGDTASAIAAGATVVVKAHSSHPATSQLSHRVLTAAAAQVGAPEGTFGIVYGTAAGADLVAHPAIKAVGFTGSVSTGRILLEVIATRRDEPIPFYGELSSINPVIVTPAAAAERADAIGAGIVGSITIGAGQLCTKPGVVLVPSGADGDALVAAARAAVGGSAAQILLNSRIHGDYRSGVDRLAEHPGVSETAVGTDGDAGYTVPTTLFETTTESLAEHLIAEIFGPTTVLVRYDAAAPVAATTDLLDVLPDSLTATLHIGADDSALAARLTDLVQPHAGRVIFNGFPTGVAVSWAQTHGGPWPATNAIHTSVGTTAVRRFLRPVTYQSAPEAILPAELRDDYTGIPRRIDGVLHAR